MMKLKPIATALAIGLALPSPGHAANDDWPKPWVLLGIDVYQGVALSRDTAFDIGLGRNKPLPTFTTVTECTAMLRRAIQRYAGKSHAEGNDGHFGCSDIRTWATSDR